MAASATSYYYSLPEWEQILSRVIQTPESLQLIGNTISVESSDSERCGVCGEVKRRQPYYEFGLGEQKRYICSKECFYYSWDNVVQSDKKRGGPFCRQLHPFLDKKKAHWHTRNASHLVYWNS